MDKGPVHVLRNTRSTSFKTLLAAILLVVASVTSFGVTLNRQADDRAQVPINAAQIVQKCQNLNLLPGPPANFHKRSHSDRFETGTPPVLFKNATIWTGRADGYEVVIGDLLLEKGLIKEVGEVDQVVLDSYSDLKVINAGGAWVTPGYGLLNSTRHVILKKLPC